MIALQYHSIESKFVFSPTIIPPKLFFRHLKEFIGKNIKFVDPKNLENDGVLITFDDGFITTFTNAFPIMEKFKVKGVVFLVVGFIGGENIWDANFLKKTRHLTKEEIEILLNSGWEIGSHSLTHPDLTKLNPKKLRREIEDSKKLLEDIFGRKVKYFSYPFGRYNQRVRELVIEAQYEMAFTSHPPVHPYKEDRFTFGRFTAYFPFFSMANRINPSNPLFYSKNLFQVLANKFSYLTGLVRHNFKFLAPLLGMDLEKLDELQNL